MTKRDTRGCTSFKLRIRYSALVERQSKRKLKALRTDNGGEYTSNRFEKYLKDEGIGYEKTVPKTPEQNGVAERLNWTLVKSARSMLLDANLSKRYWAEAVSTAVYLNNCCPTRAVQERTPYEAWHGQPPEVDHLRIFGCDTYTMFPMMREENSTQKQENVFYSVMVKKRKVTDSMTLMKRKYCTVKMCSLTKSSRKTEKAYLTPVMMITNWLSICRVKVKSRLNQKMKNQTVKFRVSH